MRAEGSKIKTCPDDLIEDVFVQETPEDIVMAHRYLYYCLSTPAVSDTVYDCLEREALVGAPESSPLNHPGSDLSSSYSDLQKEIAMRLLAGRVLRQLF